MDNNSSLIIENQNEKKSDLFLKYEIVVNLLPEEFHTVSGILYSLVITTIDNNQNLSIDNTTFPEGNQNNILPASVVTTSKGELLELMITGSSAIFQSLLYSDRLKYPLRTDEVITSEMEDSFSVKINRLSSLIPPEVYSKDGKLNPSNNKSTIDDLIIFEMQAIIRGQINRILSAGVFPLKPELTTIERGIKETELLSFSSLSTSDLYRSNQLQELAELIISVTKPLPNFTGALRTSNGEDGSVLKRRYFRHISAFILAQIFSKELLKEPTIVQKYYPLTDHLLYAISWPPPDRRNKRDKWCPPQSCLDLIKGNLADIVNPVKVPVDEVEVEGVVKEELDDEYGLETTTLTPAGKVIALIKRFSSNKNVYLSMYISDSTLGLRLENETESEVNHDNTEISSNKIMRGSFFCHTEDDIRFTVFAGPSVIPSLKPDKCGTVCISASFVGKMSVTVCSNGNVKIFSLEETRFEKKKDKVLDPLQYEYSRFVGKNGVITRTLSPTLPDGSPSPYVKDIISADGSRTLFCNNEFNRKSLDSLNHFHKKLLTDAPENWKYLELSSNGSVVFVVEDSQVTLVSHPTIINILDSIIDAEKKTEINIFQDGRMIVKYINQKVESYFSDGTIITTHSEGNVINISKPSFPSIEIDVEVDNIGRSHSQGIEVPINKGGERVRSRIALPDGTAVFIKYDTKVTATTNGSIKMVRRDKTTILVKDNGDVSYIPRNLWNKKASDSFIADCNDGIILQEISSISSKSTIEVTRNILTTPSRTTNPNTTKPTLNKTKTKTETAKVTIQTPISAETSVVEEKETQETKILMNIYKLTCFIQDYEFNRFEIDLKNNALDPKIILSGEVDGVKAPAVSEAPMEPRLFIMHRNGDAKEIISFQDVDGFEKLIECCVDSNKICSDVQSHPSDLGPAKMHKYFIQRRLLDLHKDVFSFEEVFGQRSWLVKEHTAAKIYSIRYQQPVKYKRLDIVHSPQRYFESITLIENMPLSQEGYKTLTRDIARCEEFREMRIKSINRFAVDDPRQQHEIDAEESVMKKLKLAYKVAKSNAAKRKELRDKEKGMKLDEESLGKISNNSIIVEGDEEEDEDQVEFPDDEDHVETDPEVLEIQATFQDFAIESGYDAWSSSSNHLLPMEDLRDALIRLFNQFISQEMVENGLMDCGGFDKSIKELTLSEFTGVYRSIQQRLSGNTEDLFLQVDDLNDDDTIPPNNNEINNVWDSPSPKKLNNTKILPLNLKPLEWDDASEYKAIESANNEKFPAGSAINVARRSFAAFQHQQL